jgi:hypothetical protein
MRWSDRILGVRMVTFASCDFVLYVRFCSFPRAGRKITRLAKGPKWTNKETADTSFWLIQSIHVDMGEHTASTKLEI